MILLQSQGGEGVFFVFALILRLVGVIVCSNKAKELNRSTGGWGFFGFCMPIVAMIWIHCLKPVTNWHNQTENQNQ